MSRIKQLDAFTANRIAAGEVIERPVSIVKELLENAIDANATAVTVEVDGGGIESIRVNDNGDGIDSQDVLLAFSRHATSKIASPRDLDHIATLGFRGEALCSVAAVAQVEMSTRVRGADEGAFVSVRGGKVIAQKPIGCPDGTSLIVQHLFYNTPARLKFLKKPSAEAAAITDLIARMIMARPDVSVKYVNGGKLVYHSPGDGDLRTAMHCVYGRDALQWLKPVAYRDETQALAIEGYVSSSEGAKPNRTYQSFFVNGRFVQAPLLSGALQEAFGTRLMGGRFPMCALHVAIPFDAIDVNIHPNKLAVRFKDEATMMQAMHEAVSSAIASKEVRAFVPPQLAKTEEESLRPLFRPSHIGTQDVVFVEPAEKRKPFYPGPHEDETAGKPAPAYSPIDDSFLRNIEIPMEDTASEFQLRETAQIEPEFEQTDFVPDGANLMVLGQLFGTYILVQQGDVLFIIDQHAAHERLIFDAVKDRIAPQASQQLLSGIELCLTGEQDALLEGNGGLLREMGFAWENTGEDGLLIRLKAVPQLFGESEAFDFLQDVLDAMAAWRPGTAAELKRDELAQYACKHAVRGKQTLSKQEIERLLQRFEELEEYHCPHGRPIILRMGKTDIEKAFKRIV